jgi:hypothetical protein
LAQDPSAGEPARQSRTDRAEEAARRRSNTRRRAATAIGVVVLAGVAAVLLLGGDVPIISGGNAGPREYSFELKSVKASPLSETPPRQLQDVADAAGEGVKATMDQLYFFAYVDTGSWGDYGDLFGLFEGKAVDRAEGDTDVLTLGANANDVYDTLAPTTGVLRVVVLTNEKDAAASAIAQVRFQADATRKQGSPTEITSTGSFFLRPVDGEWRVFAYRVDRDEEPGASASPTEEPA